MTTPSPVSADALGELLVLLHDADAPIDPVEATYRRWRHRERAHAAFMAEVERRGRRVGSSRQSRRRGAQPESPESEETVRIWRAGDRARVEHEGADRDGDYAVSDGALWWYWSETMGARSNQDDPSVGGSFTNDLQVMLNPPALLSSLRFTVSGTSEVAGRATITATGTPRPRDPDRGGAFELHELGTGADAYELEVDRQSGVLLAVTALHDREPFQTITTLRLDLGAQIPDERFRFQPPPGEEIEPAGGMHRIQHVTLAEAQQQTPFTVFMPDTVPDSWQVQCRLIPASQRPSSPTQLGLSYHSVDGHESVSLTETTAGPSNPYQHREDDENWDTVTRDGIAMRTRPAAWGQAQVELERDGTFVHLMSDNLTREQVLTIAAGLRAAPSTSSI